MNPIVPLIGNDWDDLLKLKFLDPDIQSLLKYLDTQYSIGEPIYPPQEDVFNALKTTSFQDTKVVILGQDPYIKPGQAHGYAFSVLPGNDIPPSLHNIFQEIVNDIGGFIPDNGCLIPWAKQGVLLLNNTLTVYHGMSNSHSKLGWSILTDFIIQALNIMKSSGIVFMLWGKNAQSKLNLIDPNTHLILTAAHPSPLAGGKFFGCKHFSKCNTFLYELYKDTIDWQIPNMEVKK